MDNFIELLKYIGPVIGVLIGWLLTRKSETDKIKYSEIRQVKRSLYVLLEIRNQLVFSKRLDRYMNVLTGKLNSKIESLIPEKIDANLFKSLLKQILPSLIGDNFQKDLKEQFKKCIDNLSKIDPLLAYRINGKQNIQDYIQSWENESKNYFEFESIEDIQNVLDHFKPKLIDEIKNDLEAIILEVAALINDKEVKNVRDLITEPEDAEIQKDIEEYLNRILEGIPARADL